MTTRAIRNAATNALIAIVQADNDQAVTEMANAVAYGLTRVGLAPQGLTIAEAPINAEQLRHQAQLLYWSLEHGQSAADAITMIEQRFQDLLRRHGLEGAP